MGAFGFGWRLVAVVVLLGVVLALAGWVEDVAAGRRPALLPGRRVPEPVPPAPVLERAHGQVSAARS